MDNSLYNRYALALLNVAIEEKKEQEYREEIKELVKILKQNRKFIYILSNKVATTEESYKLIDEVFSSCNHNIRNFIKIIYKNGRAFYLYPIFKETLYRFDDYLGIERGTIYSPNLLNKETIDKISLIIGEKINKKIELENKIDPTLIGGFKIILKNDIYDTSISSQIENIKKVILED